MTAGRSAGALVALAIVTAEVLGPQLLAEFTSNAGPGVLSSVRYRV